MRMSCPRGSWGNAKMGGNLSPMQRREQMALLTKKWRSQEVEGGVSKGKVWGGGAVDMRSMAFIGGSAGILPQKKFGKWPLSGCFWCVLAKKV